MIILTLSLCNNFANEKHLTKLSGTLLAVYLSVSVNVVLV